MIRRVASVKCCASSGRRGRSRILLSRYDSHFLRTRQYRKPREEARGLTAEPLPEVKAPARIQRAQQSRRRCREAEAHAAEQAMVEGERVFEIVSMRESNRHPEETEAAGYQRSLRQVANLLRENCRSTPVTRSRKLSICRLTPNSQHASSGEEFSARNRKRASLGSSRAPASQLASSSESLL